jgi:hypothetical protein
LAFFAFEPSLAGAADFVAVFAWAEEVGVGVGLEEVVDFADELLRGDKKDAGGGGKEGASGAM